MVNQRAEAGLSQQTQTDRATQGGSIPGMGRLVVGMSIGLWACQYGWYTINQLFMDRPGGWVLAERRIITCTIGVFICLGLGKLFARARSQTPVVKGWLVVGLGLGAALVWSLANEVVIAGIRSANGYSIEYEGIRTSILLNTAALMWVFIAWSGAWQALDIGVSLADRERQIARIEALAADARHQMLRYQLNPHFMFNTLNAIAALIAEREADKAERVVLNLSRFLRASLERSPQDKVTVADEVAVMREYLAIEQVRFEDRLAIDIRVSPQAEDCLVPGFILQPLVENAIKYAVAQTPAMVTLEIEATVEDERLSLSVRDDGPGGAAKGVITLGVGLENIRQRLQLLYGASGDVVAVGRPDGGFEARVTLPVEMGEAAGREAL